MRWPPLVVVDRDEDLWVGTMTARWAGAVTLAAWLLVIVTASFKHLWITLSVAVAAPSVPLLAHVLAVRIRWVQGDGWAPTFPADMVGLALGVIFLVSAALGAVFGSDRRPPKRPSGANSYAMSHRSQGAKHFFLWLAVLALVSAGCNDSGDEAASMLTPEMSPPPPTTAPAATNTSVRTATEGLPPATASQHPETPTTTLAVVPDVASGLFCRDLAASGYAYEQAVEYWIREGRPDRMDADRDGIPCETVYTRSDVGAHWNPPEVIQGSNVGPGDAFGYDVQLAGGRIVVSSRVGVYVFASSEQNPGWVETRLAPHDPLPGELYPRELPPPGFMLRWEPSGQMSQSPTSSARGERCTCSPPRATVGLKSE